MKFKDGYLISTGEPKKHYIESACRHVLMRQGVLGIRVKIMLAHDPEGRMGPICRCLMPSSCMTLSQIQSWEHLEAMSRIQATAAMAVVRNLECRVCEICSARQKRKDEQLSSYIG